MITRIRHMVTRVWLLASLLVFSGFGSGSFFHGLNSAQAAAGVPRSFSYQGRLLDSSGNLLGGTGTTYCFKFSLWDHVSVGSGTRVWPTSAPTAAQLTVRSGVFSANVGIDTPDTLTFNFYDNDSVFLQVEVATYSGSCGTFETVSPRQRMVAAGYAINSDLLDGATSGTGANNILKLDGSGNVALSETNPQVNASGSNTLTLQGGGGTGDVQFYSSSNKISSSGNLTIAGNLAVSGSGTHTLGGSTAITSGSLILDNNRAVQGKDTGGTARDLLKLYSDDNTHLYAKSGQAIALVPNGTDYRLFANSNGVNIGSSTAATSLLQVAPPSAAFTKAAPTTSGAWFGVPAATLTDSSTGASSTVATGTFNSFGIPTYAATNSSVTVTDAATVYIAGAPAAGTNTTITNSWSLWVGAGNTKLGGDLVIGGTLQAGTINSTGTLALASGGNANITIYPAGAGTVKIGSGSNGLVIDAAGVQTNIGTAVTDRGFDHFQDAQAAGTAAVHALAACTGSSHTVSTGITHPDVPRVVTVTDNNADVSSGNVVVYGVLADGTASSESIAITDNGTTTGSKAFAKVTSYDVPAGCAATTSLSIGVGDKLGLSNSLHGQNTVYKVKKNTADVSIPTIDTTNSTVDMATLSGGDDVTIWYKY